jgi:predicted RNA-binding Zn-ribbon protein involved in translation (DUF1610 family)
MTDFPGASAPSDDTTGKTKACPFCGETILAVAVKCKHCGEFLDSAEVAASVGTAALPPPASAAQYMTPGTSAPSAYGSSAAIKCPHCGATGGVNVRRIKQKKGVSGAKATAAVLTLGISVLGTGLSRKEKVSEAHCKNCNVTWVMG